MATATGKPRELAALMRGLFVTAVVVALAVIVAIIAAAWHTAPLDVRETRLVCQAASQLLADEDRDAADVVRLFEAAGVTEAEVGALPSSCRATWQAAMASAADLDPEAIEGACLRAGALLSAGRPELASAALTLAGVTDANARWLPDACGFVWRTSQAAVAVEKPTFDPQDQPLPPAAVPLPSIGSRESSATVACAIARRQLAQGKPADAVATLESLGASAERPSAACPGVWVVASALAEAGDSPPAAETAPQQVGGWWDDFVKNYVQPLATVGAFFLGAVLALFVAARLMVELPLLRHLDSDRRSRSRVAWLGWGLILAGSATGALLGLAVATGAVGGWMVAAAFASLLLLGLVGSFALACWLATRLKLTFSMKPETTAVTQAEIVTRLRALATESSDDIEIQSSATIKDADTALGALSSNKWIAAVQRVLLFLVGLLPWQAAVEARDSRNAIVTLSRNGRTVTAASLRLDDAGIEDLEPYPNEVGEPSILATFIAAEILLGLRPAYSADFATGLNGATVARSVALQYIAQTWYMRGPNPPQAKTLLATAVGDDPENRLAIVTLQSARFRASQDIDELIAYGDWIDETLEGYGGTSDDQ